MSNWPDIVRVVIIFLSLLSIVLLMRKAYYYWGQYQTRTKDFWWVLLCWCLAVLFGVSEVLLDWDSQARVLFTLFALILTVKLLLRPNEVDQPTFTNEF